jgi:hypothetical protein
MENGRLAIQSYHAAVPIDNIWFCILMAMKAVKELLGGKKQEEVFIVILLVRRYYIRRDKKQLLTLFLGGRLPFLPWLHSRLRVIMIDIGWKELTNRNPWSM